MMTDAKTDDLVVVFGVMGGTLSILHLFGFIFFI
jgi:hypothetical protein